VAVHEGDNKSPADGDYNSRNNRVISGDSEKSRPLHPSLLLTTESAKQILLNGLRGLQGFLRLWRNVNCAELLCHVANLPGLF
jgi:hypothetical protein